MITAAANVLQRLFPVGTRSLLWGVHQVLWHPFTVWRAWVALYGRPSWREAICILVHDWGYWGSPNMDGAEGERHPEVGAKIARWLFGPEYYDLVLLHSRHYVRSYQGVAAELFGEEAAEKIGPSLLCWPDKLSILYDPRWLYLLRARLSGEIKEYRLRADRSGFIPITATDEVWFDWIHEKFQRLAAEKNPSVVPYMADNGKSVV